MTAGVAPLIVSAPLSTLMMPLEQTIWPGPCIWVLWMSSGTGARSRPRRRRPGRRKCRSVTEAWTIGGLLRSLAERRRHPAVLVPAQTGTTMLDCGTLADNATALARGSICRGIAGDLRCAVGAEQPRVDCRVLGGSGRRRCAGAGGRHRRRGAIRPGSGYQRCGAGLHRARPPRRCAGLHWRARQAGFSTRTLPNRPA